MTQRATRAVVVGASDLGEADRLVRLLTEERGRIKVVARHARASRRRFAGVLDAGTCGIAHLRERRGGLPTLEQLDRTSGPDRARTDFDRIALLTYGCEVCAGLAPEDAPAGKLFGLLEVWLQLLEQEARPGAASRVALEAKALTFAGLAPALVRCAACGARAEEPMVFDAASGGAHHARCGGGAEIPLDALVEMEALRRSPLADTVAHELRTTQRWLLSDAVQHQLGRRLASRALLGG